MNQQNKIRLFHCCLGTWTIIALILIFSGLFIIDSLIRNMAKSSIKMEEDTYEIWGEMPGKT